MRDDKNCSHFVINLENISFAVFFERISIRLAVLKNPQNLTSVTVIFHASAPNCPPFNLSFECHQKRFCSTICHAAFHHLDRHAVQIHITFRLSASARRIFNVEISLQVSARRCPMKKKTKHSTEIFGRKSNIWHKLGLFQSDRFSFAFLLKTHDVTNETRVYYCERDDHVGGRQTKTFFKY